MKKDSAAILGFMATPLFSSIALLIITDSNLDTLALIGLLPLVYMYTGGITIMFGLPAFIILNYFDKASIYSAMIVGIIAGVIIALVLDFTNGDFSIIFLIKMSFLGGLSGLVFWSFWRLGE